VIPAAEVLQKTPGWLDWDASPSIPAFKPPAGAVDAHCHVFGPAERFPYAAERKYTPCDASRQQLMALRERLGFARNVVVQATCHGADNRALVDALTHSRGTMRGVATVKPDVGDTELEVLHIAGVRGVRFNFVKRLVDALPREPLEEIAQRVARLDRGRRSHGPARRRQARGRARVRSVPAAHARASELLVEGVLPGAPVAHGPAGL
jgi:2-pyrone-4,6-dicarboxylate lactonase